MFSYSESDAIVLPITLFILILITLTLYFTLRNKSECVKNIPLTVIAAIILFMEIIKQVREISSGDYSMWTLPLHFCSMFFIWFPMAQFLKGYWGNVGKAFAFTFSSWVVLLFYIGPSTIIGDSSQNIFGSFSSTHTFIFHHLIVLYWLLFIAFNMYKPHKKDLIGCFAVYFIYFIVAVTAAHLLQVNFTNLLTSNIPFMEQIRINAGQFIYTVLMFFLGISIAFIFWSVYYLFKKIKLRSKKL